MAPSVSVLARFGFDCNCNICQYNLRMTMSYTDSHNTSKQVQVSLVIIIPQPLHVTLEGKNVQAHLNVLLKLRKIITIRLNNIITRFAWYQQVAMIVIVA